MAYLVIWDANFNSRPLATDALGNGYIEIQQTRSAIQERLSQEHSFRFTDVNNTNQGKHLQGSARIFVSDTEPADPSTVVADNGDYAVGRMLFKPTLKELLIRTVSGWVNVLKSGLDAIFNSITAISATITDATITDATITNATITNSMVGDGVIKNKTNLSTVEYDQDNLLLLDITDNVLKKATPANIIKGHTDATSVHGATSAPTANRLILRDASGRAKVAAPSDADDIARKDYVDNRIVYRTYTGNTAFEALNVGQFAVTVWTFSSDATITFPSTGTYVMIRNTNGTTDAVVVRKINGGSIHYPDSSYSPVLLYVLRIS